MIFIKNKMTSIYQTASILSFEFAYSSFIRQIFKQIYLLRCSFQKSFRSSYDFNQKIILGASIVA